MKTYFATVPREMEGLLASELEALGAERVRQTVAGVHFGGPLEVAYRAVLWSRLANAILLPLDTFDAPDPEALYEGVGRIRWDEHMDVDSTLAVTFHASQSRITHTHFGALKVKDAIVDKFRARFGRRPSVDTRNPDLHVNVHLHRDRATVSVDLSGTSLHRRAYREQSVAAPLKENVAAALLLRAGWPELAAAGAPLIDPLCGSGTILIEAAMMAADIAPGLLRTQFGFTNWKGHDAALWADLLLEARERRSRGLAHLPPIYGFDRDLRAINAARTNVEAAGLDTHIRLQTRELRDAAPPAALERPSGKAAPPDATPSDATPSDATPLGLVVTNPPYGERLGTDEGVRRLHGQLGRVLLEHFEGWKATVITGSKELGMAIGIRARKTYTLYNGPIRCVVLNFDVAPSRAMGADRPPRKPRGR